MYLFITPKTAQKQHHQCTFSVDPKLLRYDVPIISVSHLDRLVYRLKTAKHHQETK